MGGLTCGDPCRRRISEDAFRNANPGGDLFLIGNLGGDVLRIANLGGVFRIASLGDVFRIDNLLGDVFRIENLLGDVFRIAKPCETPYRIPDLIERGGGGGSAVLSGDLALLSLDKSFRRCGSTDDLLRNSSRILGRTLRVSPSSILLCRDLLVGDLEALLWIGDLGTLRCGSVGRPSRPSLGSS